MTKLSLIRAFAFLLFCCLHVPAFAQNNTVAILPFGIVSNDAGLSSDEMAKMIQADCENSFAKNTSMQVQASRTTNAILLKNNVALNSLDAMAPNDLAKMLGVQYVVFGKAEIQNKGTNTYGSNYATYDSKTKRNDDNRKSSGSSFGSSNSSTTLQYQTHLNLEMYDANGSRVYSERREPFGSGPDGYKSGLDYLIKRSPFGSKHKK